jgi:anti-anti-sigma factor
MNENQPMSACRLDVPLLGDLPSEPHHLQGRGRPADHPGPALIVKTRGEVILVEFENAQLLIDEWFVHEVGARLRGLAAEGRVRILVNLAGVEYASSALLANLAWLHRRVFEARGFLRIYGLTAVFRDALRSCALDRVFEIHPTEQEALGAGNRATLLVSSGDSYAPDRSALASP